MESFTVLIRSSEQPTEATNLSRGRFNLNSDNAKDWDNMTSRVQMSKIFIAKKLNNNKRNNENCI
jgi:hypothetical protein